jgi:hypothetical protein
MAAIASQRAEPEKPRIPRNRTSRKPGRINLKAVSEVLAERGLDPTEAIIDILCPVDDEGQPMDSMLDADTRARVLSDLLQYTQPKLKSIEVKAKVAVGTFDVTNEQARKIAEEFLLLSQGEAK